MSNEALYHYAQHHATQWVIDYDTLPIERIILPDTINYTLHEGRCPEGFSSPPPMIVE
ncbi:MAG: hypothetical protein ACKO37_04920 [Vampirovibrionales bacterium]